MNFLDKPVSLRARNLDDTSRLNLTANDGEFSIPNIRTNTKNMSFK